MSRVLQSGLVPRGTRVQVFREIYWAFLILGTLVGVIVISYMLYNGYKYRYEGGDEGADEERPQLGEIPTGGGKGRKLFLSFGLSAIIVISLIAWTYGALLYVEQNPPAQGQQDMGVRVEGYQFGWDFTYTNVQGHENGRTSGELVVPKGAYVSLTVTSRDVFHNFGIPELKVKTDAIPGQTTDTWFVADQTGTYTAHCYELCGQGHSYMTAKVRVVPQSEFDQWYTSNSTS